MSPDHVVRAWKDASYGACLSADTAASLPAHPVGPIDIADSALDLAGASVASRTEYVETLGCCQGFTQAGKCDFTLGYPYCTTYCITIILTGASLC
jgi:mersacidin/lichenicidin family type 2 lantibiotic